ncbi:MAG: ATP-binding protein [Synergistaceae bacterium]|jgi:anti-sigma regulatory factor (Ser/Thr protein kinase)|nr:ATP-binding protein [Synergistaceae bacterium]
MTTGRGRRYDANLDGLEDLYSFISTVLAENGVAESIVAVLEMAADEIFSNIVNYGYGEKREGAEIDVFLDVKDGVVEMVFCDNGSPFDPLAREAPDISLSLEERQIGGLGIHIVKNSVDEITYSRRDDRNVLTLKKSVKP